MENKLYQKKIIWNGDSICAGSKQTGNWATRIADNCGAQCINYAVGGGTKAEGLPKMKSGADRHSVSATLDKMYAEHPEYVRLKPNAMTSTSPSANRLYAEVSPALSAQPCGRRRM